MYYKMKVITLINFDFFFSDTSIYGTNTDENSPFIQTFFLLHCCLLLPSPVSLFIVMSRISCHLAVVF